MKKLDIQFFICYGAMGLWGYGAMGLWGYGAIIHSIYRMTMPSLVLL